MVAKTERTDEMILAEMDIFHAKEINVGRFGILRSIEFQKLIMDKDYIWKLEIILDSNINSFEMYYDCSILFDPKKYNDQLQGLMKEARSKQTSMEAITGKLKDEIGRVHDKYAAESELFVIVDFKAALLKMEKKQFGKQLLQLCIDTEAAVKISKLVNNLDSAAIVLKPQTKANNDEE